MKPTESNPNNPWNWSKNCTINPSEKKLYNFPRWPTIDFFHCFSSSNKREQIKSLIRQSVQFHHVYLCYNGWLTCMAHAEFNPFKPLPSLNACLVIVHCRCFPDSFRKFTRVYILKYLLDSMRRTAFSHYYHRSVCLSSSGFPLHCFLLSILPDTHMCLMQLFCSSK